MIIDNIEEKIKSGNVKIMPNGWIRVLDPHVVLNIDEKGFIIRYGKRKFRRVILKNDTGNKAIKIA